MSIGTAQPVVGLIGLGDQGLPAATAIAEAGYRAGAFSGPRTR